MKKLISVFFLLAIISSCQTEKKEQATLATTNELDRTILPMVAPINDPITEFDARNATAPKPFNITAPKGAPNVVIVLIDDIGFSASSTFGGVIATPHFSKLADEGLKFNQFHTTALCSPTRAALKSGRNHHATNVGSTQEIATGFPGNQGVIPNNAIPLAEILRQNGYSTAAFGKWHETPPWEVSVSGPFDRWPTHQGFDKFYGFIGGETNQFEPLIYDGQTKMEKPDVEDYHFTTDMTNQAINWIKIQQSLTPDKPFMVYYAPGAVHAPHHAPKEWIEKYKGKFDDGWDKLREETLERQKSLGIIPQNTKLVPKPRGIKDWEELSADEQKLFAIQMETFAGFTEHTDNEVGRLLNAIDEIGELDNTLFIYIMGDNGSSAEGGFIGTFNEMAVLNGVVGAETVESMLEIADVWGSEESFPHFAAGWAIATDVPFAYSKQVASDFGGTRNGMVMHWPNGFDSKGEIRNQWHHVNDVAPTVLAASNIPQPTMVNGVVQRPMDGVSMLYCLDNADAKDQHTTQYFEMLGNRAIYHEGWYARVIHKLPWERKPINTLQEDVWELYNTIEDFSLSNNIAEQNPDKLEQLKKIFDQEALKNNVYPLDDRTVERFNASVAGRPDLMAGRTSLTLTQGMTGIMENAFINVKNKSITIEAKVDLVGNDKGIILCQGGRFGGWALYMDNGKPTYMYNYFGLSMYTVQSPTKIADKNATIKLVFDYDGGGFGKGGLATIFVNGEKMAEGRIDRTVPFVFSGDETADVGIDDATQVVSLFSNAQDSKFTGYVTSVVTSFNK